MKKCKTILLMLMLVFLFLIPTLNSIDYSLKKKDSEIPQNSSYNSPNFDQIGVPSIFPEFSFNTSVFDQSNISKWKEITSPVDQNCNGINDKFEDKLSLVSEFGFFEANAFKDNLSLSEQDLINGFFGDNKQNSERISYDHIPVIINFPEGDFNPISSLFESLGGSVKSTYKAAINGFAGAIDYDGLNQFCDILLRENIPFLIEEDGIYKANLYYATRNMNLRPYVWNTLGYTGDEFSSTAVIDTGIDDSHDFFTPGYSDGNFNYKIVGWNDVVNGLAFPYDDHGHGSHCAGIATGEGVPVLDEYERTVSTYSLGFRNYYFYEGIINIKAARFNVTEPGIIDIRCEFNDSTPVDEVHCWAYLYHNETIVDSHIVMTPIWEHTLSYTVTENSLGDYSLRISLDMVDNDGWDVDNVILRFKGEIHWPFHPPLLNSGDPWKGVAPDTHLVGVKVLDSEGSGWVSDILNGLDWIITNRFLYNITTISMSLGGAPGDVSMIEAANNAVEKGLVTVVAAGNDGGKQNTIGSPGDADNVITVAAMSNADQVTDYSSSGGNIQTGTTIKPDIMAPGGSFYNFSIFSTDTNDNDASGEFPTDSFFNDMHPMLGTSMATPAVAGAANLLIDAMGGHQNWNYTALESKRVKALLLMTATETYPLTRELDTSFSPLLNRGGKDTHEGYGRLNIDAALEAYTQEIVQGSNKQAWLSSSLVNPFNKHALGCYVNLISGENYNFYLETPEGADFDLHLYSNTPNLIGEPIMVASSNSSQLGMEESITFTPTKSGRYYLIAKAISGEGYANISYKRNIFAPTLINGAVLPLSGNQLTLFNFSVIYSDQDDNSPSIVNVLINGTIYPMEKQNRYDINYRDGCIYQLSIYLQPGLYNYSFECNDGIFYNLTDTYFGLNVVEILNLNAPILRDGQVTPSRGYTGTTTFLFAINYIDADNNAPEYINITINSMNYSMHKQDPLDTNYKDGCRYVFNTVLNEIGTYTYYFNCSDGIFTVNVGPFIGPSVNESSLFNGMYINYIHKMLFGDYPARFDYHQTSESRFHVVWNSYRASWDVDVQTRIITNTEGDGFGNYVHTPLWILKDTELGDLVPIGVIGYRDGDHLFNVSNELIYHSPEGPLEVWVLEDLTTPGVAWYEKSSGILLKGNFYYFEPYGNNIFYSFDFLDSNIEFIYVNSYLIQGAVEPTTGSSSISYNFTVNYINLVNTPPTSIQVIIDSISYDMSPVNPLDTNYGDGVMFQYTNNSITVGNHEFYFVAMGGGQVLRYPYPDDEKLEFKVLSYEFSKLFDGMVSPLIGDETTNYKFSVIYQDTLNNTPSWVRVYLDGIPYSMIKDPLDYNFSDGVEYYYQNSSMAISSHNFYFEAFNTTHTLRYPDVGVLFGPHLLKNYTMIPNYTYNWIDATLGIRCSMDGQSSDNQRFSLPFTFKFYNESFDQIYVYTSGCVSFIDNYISKNYLLPCYLYPYLIAPYWDRLEASSPCNIFVRNLTSPNRVVIEWQDYYTVYNDLVGTFEIILYESGSIIFNYDYLDYATGYTCGLNFGLDPHYYNIYTNLTTLTNDFSILFIPQVNYYAPNLTLGSVIPTSGDQSTQFNFSVVYTDQDDNAPSEINVLINGTQYPMVKQDLSDFNYTDGCLYQYLTYLQPGIYNYSFECCDEKFFNSTETYTSLSVADFTVNTPVLSGGQVNPDPGYKSKTMFVFTLNYTHADNKAPVYVNITINSTIYSMVKQNLLDANYMDGCIYTFSTMLDELGEYFYYLNCSDGYSTAKLGPFIGPFVKKLPLFEGMYINHIYTYDGSSGGPSRFEYFETSGDLFLMTWNWWGFPVSWTENIYTRIISNDYNYIFDPDSHTPVWIFTDITLGESFPIGIVYESEHIFQVSDELVYFLPGFGPLEVWVLEDLTTPGVAWYEKSTGILLNGTFYDSGGFYTFDFVDTNVEFAYQSSSFAPELTSGFVMPLTGDQNTQFTFSVVYTDQDNNPPMYINILINGTPYPMVKQNPTDLNYIDGCTYQYLTYLSPGDYNYSFECNDSVFINSTPTYGLVVDEANSVALQLLNPEVSPRIEGNSSLFNFTVWYFDNDNNFPIYINITINTTTYAMLPVDPLDDDVTDGAQYYFTTLLDFGYYQFQINSSDGLFTNSTGWLTGPEVNPFLTVFKDDFENDLSKWEIITGLWHLTDTNSSWLNPCHSPNHSMWFGLESIGTYDTGSRAMGDLISIPIDLSAISQANLEFYHWREGEPFHDFSYVYISTDGASWDLLNQTDEDISLWEKVTFNISGYCGNNSVRIRFNFDTFDSLYNFYRGWLVDDVLIYSLGDISSNLFLPENNSNIVSGWTDFIWYSLDLIAGPVNYTLQISNISDFSNIIYELENINEKPDNTSVSILIDFPIDRYYWRVRPSFGPFNGNWSNYFMFNLIAYDFAPNLISGSVIPSTGDQFTEFNFSVIYKDQDNNPPININVILNGTPYPMVKQDPSDLNYADGCLYQYLTSLSPGVYSYSFECNDSVYYNSTSIYGLIVNKANIFAPQLLNPQLSPKWGVNSTLFNYSIWYFDADNNFPIYINITINFTTYVMQPVDPLDDNVTDGAQYYLTTLLDFGYYQFQINCSDGLFTTSTGWLTGPDVDPFYGSIVINEISAGSDYIELYNYGPDRNMTGWTIQIYDRNSLYKIYSFPTGWVFYEHYVVVLRENAGTDTDNILYTGWNIPWVSSGIAIGLFDNTGAHIDWFQTSDFSGSKPSDVEWEQDISLILNNNYAYRTSDVDTDRASNWIVAASGSEGLLNPGQTGKALNLLSPPNGSSQFIGWIKFIWASLELPFGSVNYTLQISNVSDFTNIIYETGIIHELPGNTSISILIDYPLSLYYWRVRPSFGSFDGNWSDYFIFNLLANDFAPSLTSGSVTPPTGDDSTQFNFSVVYVDQDNSPPIFINILINGTPYSMVQQDPSDLNYMDGCLYQYLTFLIPGTYNYSFECNDSLYYNATPTYVGLVVTRTNNFAPSLTSGSVAPPTGDDSTQFNFSVVYVDQDNNAPAFVNVLINGTPYPTVQQDPSDLNYMDGCLYQYLTFLTPGTYNYSFECNDSLYYNATPTYVGLVVTETNNFAPFLTSGSVAPPTGDDSTQFNFSVVYVDQDNNAPAFINTLINGTPYPMVQQDPSDLNYMDGCLYQYLTYLAVGVYDYSFECNDSIYYNATPTYVGLVVTETNDFAPSLTSGSVAPPTGDDSTQFNFSVVYVDQDNNAPAFVNVLINGTPYPMVQQDPSDLNYMDGCLYQYLTYLAVGVYDYSFECNDSIYYNATPTYVDLVVTETNNFAPSLTSGSVAPPTGDDSTQFNFSVVYVDQDNNAPAFVNGLINGTPYPMVQQDPSDLNYADGCLYQYLTFLTPGTYNYSFECNDSLYYNATPTYVGLVVTETNDFPPSLTSGSVAPPTGDDSTQFNFSVIYVDQDNNAPAFINTLINGTPYPMVQQDPSDLNYMDGCLYQYLTFLTPGTYNYSFECNDSIYYNATPTYVGLVVTETNDFAPSLTSGSVAPPTGDDSTQFNFSVIYVDQDNNAPAFVNVLINGTPYPMVQQDPSDLNYMDGCLYQYLTFLTPGTYNYSFECNDSLYYNSTATVVGLVVSES
ncbi:MAG: S8 family serine peptidase, partial [Candidatus Helarchaeota archaeon]|nr:S8 family serine peptidase [Candidatus Helarchaeota archaeon]